MFVLLEVPVPVPVPVPGVRVCACRAQLQSSLEAVKKPGVERSGRPRKRLNNPMSSPVSNASRVQQLLTAPVLQRSHLAC